MKPAFRLFKRKETGRYFLQSTSTGQQRSLKTTDEDEAKRLLEAENNSRKASALNIELGKVYFRASDPRMESRTWQAVMDELSSHGKEASQKRCKRAMASRPFAVIRDKKLLDTTAEDLQTVLNRGGSAANNYLRRLHNLAFKNRYLPSAIFTAAEWEKPKKKPKRAITFEEHQKIIAGESNEERKHYYEMLWLVGSAQTDGSFLNAADINWKTRVLSYQRQKTKEWCFLQIGTELELLLKKLPSKGFLFPKIVTLTENERAAEFYRRKKLLGISGVSLHSYRYAWAERAYAAGYPERYAQAALGHSSRAVHHAYAKAAKVVCPPLETNGGNIVPFLPEIKVA